MWMSSSIALFMQTPRIVWKIGKKSFKMECDWSAQVWLLSEKEVIEVNSLGIKVAHTHKKKDVSEGKVDIGGEEKPWEWWDK